MRWVGLVAALVLLNVSLTFTNIWPTLGVRLNADLSVETALCVLGLVLVRRWHGPGRAALRWLAGLLYGKKRLPQLDVGLGRANLIAALFQ